MEDTPGAQHTKSESNKSTGRQDGGPYSCTTRHISSVNNSTVQTLIKYEIDESLTIKEEFVPDQESHQLGKHNLLSVKNELEEEYITTEISAVNNSGAKTLIEHDYDEALEIEEEIDEDDDLESIDADDKNDPDYVPDLDKNESEDDETVDNSVLSNEVNPIVEGSENDVINVSSDKIIVEGKSAGHITNMYVTPSDGSARYNACLLCSKKFTQISKHLQRVHKNNPRVKALMKLSNASKEKVKLLADLRREGNARFNKNQAVNNGEIIVNKRSKKIFKNTANDYLPCAICKDTFSKKSLRKHFRKCSRKTNNERIVLAVGRLESDRIEPIATVRTRKEICYIRDDDVGRTIRKDPLIIDWANQLFDKYRLNQEQDMVRARLRLIGRFLIAVKKIDNRIQNLREVFDPKYYDAAMEAVHVVAQFNPSTEVFECPSNGSRIGTFLKVIGQRLISMCIREHNEEDQKNVENFLKIHNEEFSLRVNSTVSESEIKNTCHKKVELPLDSDINKLQVYAENERCLAYLKLKDNFDFVTWKKLSEMTLLSILIFNRRRPGEVERISIDDFNNRHQMNYESTKKVFESLSESGKRAVEKYHRITIRGKKGRIVPVLLSQNIIDSVQLIIDTRRQAKVHEESPYVFGISNFNGLKTKYIRASVVMREASQACDAEKPHLLRATILRKHIATKFLSLQLSENQVDDLANSLGHHKDIHKQIYRQAIPELEIAKVAGILEAAMGDYSEDEKDVGEEDITENKFIRKPKPALKKKREVTTYIVSDRTSSKPEHEQPSTSKKRNRTAEDELLDVLDGTGKTKMQKKKRRCTSPYGKTKRKPWSLEEANTVKKIFKPYFSEYLNTGPSQKDVQKAIKEHKQLQGRTISQIKTWINNNQRNIKNKQ